MALTVTSAFGIVSCEYRILKDGTAITIKIKQGIKVHNTSTATLWVLFDGTGFADARNLMQAYTIKNNTKTLIAIMIGNNNLSWKFTISLIVEDAASWKPSCQSFGWLAKAFDAMKYDRNIYKNFFIFLPYIECL